ncbi:Kelch-like protein 32, partial [Ameca splendens]
AMFSLCMVESEADEVTLQGVTSVGLKHALDFAYTGQILLEPAIIQDVLSAGSHLQLLELLSLCSSYLIQLMHNRTLNLSSVHFVCPKPLTWSTQMTPFLMTAGIWCHEED